MSLIIYIKVDGKDTTKLSSDPSPQLVHPHTHVRVCTCTVIVNKIKKDVTIVMNIVKIQEDVMYLNMTAESFVHIAGNHKPCILHFIEKEAKALRGQNI